LHQIKEAGMGRIMNVTHMGTRDLKQSTWMEKTCWETWP